MIPGAWKTALIDINVSDVLSEEVDLEGAFEFLTVLVPTITSSTIGVNVAKEKGGTYFPLYRLDDDATGDFLDATTAGTATKAVVFKIGGCQYVKISAGSAQGADKTFYVRGHDGSN